MFDEKSNSRIPDDMMDFVNESLDVAQSLSDEAVASILGAGFCWLREHPTVPTEEDQGKIFDSVNGKDAPSHPWRWIEIGAIEWQKKLLIGIPGEIPDELRTLLWDEDSDPGQNFNFKSVNADILEAYYLGRNAAKEKPGERT